MRLIRISGLNLAALGLAAGLALSCNSGTPDPAVDSLARGVAAQNAGKPEEARRAYFETLGADPKNVLAFYNLGQIARIANKPGIAEGYYRQALEIETNHAPSLFGLAYVRAQQDGMQEAIALYRRVIALDPNNGAAHYNLGLLLRIAGAIADGDAEIARGRQIDPSLPAPGPAPSASASPKR